MYHLSGTLVHFYFLPARFFSVKLSEQRANQKCRFPVLVADFPLPTAL